MDKDEMSEDRNIGCMSFVLLALVGTIVMAGTTAQLSRIASALEKMEASCLSK